jgi:hypothetical protein
MEAQARDFNLLHCPFCGSTEGPVAETIQTAVSVNQKAFPLYLAWCDDCGSAGRWSNISVAEAAAFWNTRAGVPAANDNPADLGGK